MKIKSLAVIAAAVALSACYHVTVDTGRPPSAQSIERPWAPSFVGGLVPPPILETAAQCPNGVSKVETQLSPLNLLVAVVTAWLYSPMTITVQCASPGGGDRATLPRDVQSVSVGAHTTLEQALQRAVRLSLDSGQPVYITR